MMSRSSCPVPNIIVVPHLRILAQTLDAAVLLATVGTARAVGFTPIND